MDSEKVLEELKTQKEKLKFNPYRDYKNRIRALKELHKNINLL